MVLDIYSHEYFMKEALKEASKAFDKSEVPVGAIIVSDNHIIARAHNLTEQLNDITAHAEMQAITAASNYLDSKYLIDCTIYVTLEPCMMCAAAIGWCQIRLIVFGAADPKKGYSKISSSVLHPKTKVIKGVMEEECAKMLMNFFKSKR